MGFEIVYKYYDRMDDGKYNVSETKELKKKVGNQQEEVSYEKLAAIIMGQLARRDIMVFDAEIYEFTKRPISFKESAGGIIIKGKKYAYGSTTELPEVVEQPQYEDDVPQQHPHQQQNLPAVRKAAPVKSAKVLRYEYFEPHKDLMLAAKKRNLKFTFGNQYPIFEERPDPRGIMYGMNYVTADDDGNRRTMNDKFFIFRAKLEGGTQFQDSNGPTLDYGATIADHNPVVLR